MTRDRLAALLDAAYTKRADDSDLPRRPESNNPWQAEPRRERRTRPTYSDPTGTQAVGHIEKQRKKEQKA
ncbi:hypothetical protein C1N80_06340 [Brachybacterium sp. SGAir0954]|uniref:hypothetical protein n=1 Tax=Brachybacterium sp. SGAir0954 TaxID=2571029 RepID=UPI0010CD00A9|nr:hypothetical protein [Brachybacterium sp. SGAir0954]QCR53239.1 hypothetical protein C1N80_06340 [Brachybacterium sp. SGAir0954]